MLNSPWMELRPVCRLDAEIGEPAALAAGSPIANTKSLGDPGSMRCFAACWSLTLLLLLLGSASIPAADAPFDLKDWTPRPAAGKAEPWEKATDAFSHSATMSWYW